MVPNAPLRALRWTMVLAREERAEIVAVYALGPVEDLASGAANAVSAGLGMSRSMSRSWRDELRRELEQDWGEQEAGQPSILSVSESLLLGSTSTKLARRAVQAK